MAMASRAAGASMRLLRPISARVSARAQGIARRNMSSSSHGHKKSSDMPWIVGSTIVFVPTILYLLRPQESHGHAHSHHGKEIHHEKDAHEEQVAEVTPESTDAAAMTDDEGTEVSAEEVNASMQQSFESNSPKDAQAAEASAASLPK